MASRRQCRTLCAVGTLLTESSPWPFASFLFVGFDSFILRWFSNRYLGGYKTKMGCEPFITDSSSYSKQKRGVLSRPVKLGYGPRSLGLEVQWRLSPRHTYNRLEDDNALAVLTDKMFQEEWAMCPRYHWKDL